MLSPIKSKSFIVISFLEYSLICKYEISKTKKLASSYILINAVVSSAPIVSPVTRQVNSAIFWFLNNFSAIRYTKILENTEIIMFSIIPVHFVKSFIVKLAAILSNR